MSDIYTKIANDHYRNQLPYARKSVCPETYAAYNREEARLHDLFKSEALAECGLTGHPKADKAFSFAWEHGHANGFNDVMGYLDGIAEVLLD